MEQIKANLHIHSRFSDGTLWPKDIVDQAKSGGLTHIALTDHDSMAGVSSFTDACADSGIVGMAGVEIDCVAEEIDFDKELLGYFPNGNYENTFSFSEERRRAREKKMLGYLHNVEKIFACRLSLEDVRRDKIGEASFRGEPIVLTKVDLWKCLKNRGVIPSELTYEEFKACEVCAEGVKGAKPTLQEVATVILSDGGYPVLPHIGHLFNDSFDQLSKERARFEEILSSIKGAGVAAVELYCYLNDDRGRINEFVQEVAGSAGFEFTWGSDYHGPDSRNKVLAEFWGSSLPACMLMNS